MPDVPDAPREAAAPSLPRRGTLSELLADAPLYQAWCRFLKSDPAPFTIPGHKRRAGRLDRAWGRLLDADIPLYGGAAPVKGAHDLLRAAEAQAGALWGADLCRFSTGGSTHANQVLCLALARPGGIAIVARNAHRSIVSGLALAGLRPVWLPVEVDGFGVPLGVDPEAAGAALDAYPDAVGLWITDPSYLGTISDGRALADAAHQRGVPLVVDAAWGAHLGFAPSLPQHPLQLGADAVVTSAHKMLPAFSQAALINVQTQRIDPDRVDRAFDATHTTSPTVAILASIDASRALLASREGAELLDALAARVERVRAELGAGGVSTLGPQDYPPGRFDPAKLVLRLTGSGFSGIGIEDALLATDIPVEMADRHMLVAQVGLTDDDVSLGRLLRGAVSAVRTQPGSPGMAPAAPAPSPEIPPQRLSPREAFFAKHTTVSRANAVGRIAAELVAPYPPGIPVVVPGEELTASTLAHLDAQRDAGTRIAYAADPSLSTFQVVVR